MKKVRFLLLGFALMLTFVSVNAKDVSTMAELEACLTGSETECKLIADEITTTTDLTLSSTSARNVTWNLNGKTFELNNMITVGANVTLTITGNGTIEGYESDYLLYVKDGGTLILENGTYKNTANAGGVVGLIGATTDTTTKTTLTVKNGVVLTGNYGINVAHAGSGGSYGVVVNFDGEIKSITENDGYDKGTVGISVNGYVTATSGNVPVINITENAKIKTVEGTCENLNDADAPAIYAAGYAIWNISGGTIEGSEALSIKSGKFNITGGTLKAFGKYQDPATAYNDGSEATGAAISITANKDYPRNVEISIADVTVTSENGYAVYEGNTSSTETAVKSMEITSGSFTTNGEDEDGNALAAVETANVEGFIKGGTYSTDVEEEYLSTDLVTKEDEDGNYLVGVEHEVTVSASLNGEVEVDKEKAVKGEKVTITTTPAEGYELDEITVKVVGSNTNETVTVTDGKFEMPDASVEVSATFVEVEEDAAGDIENPSTGDNIMLYVILGLVSLAGLTVVIKKRNFN